MIGASIFTIPAQLQRSVGPAGLLSYLIVIVAVYCMARALARVAARYPGEGSFYLYASGWAGHYYGIIASGSYLIGLTIAIGLLGTITGSYLQVYFPFSSAQTLSQISLLSLTLLNMAGAVISQVGQVILIVLTILPLLIIMGLCFSKANVKNLVPFAPEGVASILSATRAVIFGFFGFEASASLYGIVENAENNVPKAITYALVATSMLYLLFVTAIFLALPRDYFTSSTMPLSNVLMQIFPGFSWLVRLIHVSILLTIMGTMHSLIWSLGTLLEVLIKKLYPPITRVISLKSLQRCSVVLIGLGASISSLFFVSINLLFSLVALFVVFALASSMVPLLLLDSNEQSSDRLLGICGLCSAGLMFFCAVVGIVQALT
jgi:amino acid transporter